MRIYKDTPFELSLMPWELEPPRTTLMLVVKATFAFGEDGPCTVADEQVTALGEVPWEDGDPPSLRTESDYAVLKPRGEWYLVGTAHAPGGKPATVVPVKVRVGSAHKQLVVWGDRTWERGLLGQKPSAPTPFTSMPLRWERSFGGPQIPENPVGRGTGAVEVDKTSIDPLPNIEDPASPIVSRDDRPPPAGMFPIPNTWRSRIGRTGTYDELWKRSRWPFFPRDFDFSFFNCAPMDQWIEGYWRGDEALELSGLHPTKTRIRTSLPGLIPRLFVERTRLRPEGATPLELLSRAELEALGTPKLEEVPLKLDTIVLDTDAEHALCQWRGLVQVADGQLSDVARVFVVHEPMGQGQPHDAYEGWLLRKLLEEADEFDPPDEEEALEALPSPDEESTDDEPLDEMQRAQAQMAEGLQGFVNELAEIVPPTPLPEPSFVRAKYVELGLDPALLPEPEPPELPEDDDPPSLRRLAALIRRRLKIPFCDLDLSDAPYQKLDLSGVDFSRSILTGASFRGANIRGAVFDEATLSRVELGGADARGASFREADVSELSAAEALFAGAVFDGASGSHASFRASSFAGASLEGVELEECDLAGCHLREAKLDGADFTGSTLDGADFTGSSMVDVSLESVHAHDVRFERCRMPDLRASDGADFTRARFVLIVAPGAQFQGAALNDADFSGSDLEGADFSEARAERVNLLKCQLKGACFDRANLTQAVLLAANAFEASFQEAELAQADARGASFFSADLWRARTGGAVFEGANLERTLLEGKVR